MSGFKMDDYVDVAERIRNFAERFPEGSLQSQLTRLDDGWLCKAWAYRTADDHRPGVGHAFEAVPGKTPYTKDSEAMNAETSAWGRAIVALGFETKKIASAQEVKARQGAQPKAAPPKPPETDALYAELVKLGETYAKLEPEFSVNDEVKIKSQNHIGKAGYEEWLRKYIAALSKRIDQKIAELNAQETFPIPEKAKAAA